MSVYNICICITNTLLHIQKISIDLALKNSFTPFPVNPPPSSKTTILLISSPVDHVHLLNRKSLYVTVILLYTIP